jgi:Restriction alleviation protein Lar
VCAREGGDEGIDGAQGAIWTAGGSAAGVLDGEGACVTYRQALTEEEYVRLKDPQRKGEKGIMNKCPFCKGEKLALMDYTKKAEAGDAWVRCITCEAEGPYATTTMEAIVKWNEAKR